MFDPVGNILGKKVRIDKYGRNMSQENYEKAEAYLKEKKIPHYSDYTSTKKEKISINPNFPVYDKEVLINNPDLKKYQAKHNVDRKVLTKLADETTNWPERVGNLPRRFIFHNAKKIGKKKGGK